VSFLALLQSFRFCFDLFIKFEKSLWKNLLFKYTMNVEIKIKKLTKINGNPKAIRNIGTITGRSSGSWFITKRNKEA
jgi:hypothetical protein